MAGAAGPHWISYISREWVINVYLGMELLVLAFCVVGLGAGPRLVFVKLCLRPISQNRWHNLFLFERASPILHPVLTLPKRTSVKLIVWLVAGLLPNWSTMPFRVEKKTVPGLRN